jgi:tetratricopeptide (TPR) repeat protein
VLVGLWLALLAADRTFDLEGQIHPKARAGVYLHGSTSPFQASTLSDGRGRFQFRKLAAGAYTIVVFVPGRGETRRTIDVGPGLADARGRVPLTVEVVESKLVVDDSVRRKNLISVRELSISDQARREYNDAQKKLGRRDVEGAIGHLERAVKLAPQFSAAWNNLGTIAYQTRQFPQAESHFRRALEADPEAYEPAVNLGGVLLTLEKPQEALSYNLYCTLQRPNDALANSQLGMNYFYLGDLERALKYLNTAKGLDPGHFSHPQLLLVEIYLRRNDPAAAAAEMEDFLRHHPDWPAAAKMREAIAKLRASPVQPVPQP